ncbi:hypothetical protein CEP51_006837 [Fusarium floridanum]|uniref:Uncharacterized protein n=1 Tax=Fusarium floridanum TaxID=1325733 RepID=A0A428RR86_9HYPO|nr:hypothetical protein CEP51_006837 [Fusarium floridanum]
MNKAIVDAEATGAPLPVKWISIPCTYASVNQRRCDLCEEQNRNCQPTLEMIDGNIKGMDATISNIRDLMSIQDASPTAAIEQGDEVPYILPRSTRAGMVKALAKLGEAFNEMVTSHLREHGLLGSFGQDVMQSRENTYQDNVAARWEGIYQLGLLAWLPSGSLRLHAGDDGFREWNNAVQEFYRDITHVMEQSNIAQADISATLNNLPM